jgi:hypothetical protein
MKKTKHEKILENKEKEKRDREWQIEKAVMNPNFLEYIENHPDIKWDAYHFIYNDEVPMEFVKKMDKRFNWRNFCHQNYEYVRIPFLLYIYKIDSLDELDIDNMDERDISCLTLNKNISWKYWDSKKFIINDDPLNSLYLYNIISSSKDIEEIGQKYPELENQAGYYRNPELRFREIDRYLERKDKYNYFEQIQIETHILYNQYTKEYNEYMSTRYREYYREILGEILRKNRLGDVYSLVNEYI